MTQQIGDSELLDTWAANGGVSEPDSSKIDVGWQSGERPSFQVMNWLQNLYAQKLNHILQNGIPAWNSTTQYEVGNVAINSGLAYRCITQNTNSAPPSANWAQLVPDGLKNTATNRDPLATDDNTQGYEVFSRWVNTSTGESWVLLNAATGAANWDNTTLTIDDLGSAALQESSAFATAAQGALADSALQPGSVPVATEAQAKAATAGNLLDADVARFSPFAIAAYLHYNQVTDTVLASNNISSVTDVATTEYRANFTNNMATANFAAVPGVGQQGAQSGQAIDIPNIKSRNTSSVTIKVKDTNGNSQNDLIDNNLIVAGVLA